MADNFLKFPIWSALTDLVDKKIRSAFNKAPQTMPCSVASVDKEFVVVKFEASNGVNTISTMRMPQAFSAYAREPTQEGDKGYAVPNDYYLGGISGYSGGTANLRGRGNIATHVFHPVSQSAYPSRDYNQYHITGGPTGVYIQTSDNSVNMLLNESGITITGNLMVSGEIVAKYNTAPVHVTTHLHGGVVSGGNETAAPVVGT